MTFALICFFAVWFVTLFATGLRATTQPDPSSAVATRSSGTDVNDIHSQLNRTRVARVVKPTTMGELQTIIREAKHQNQFVSISGGRHAMGGQQFGENTLLIDMRGLNRVVSFDSKRGILNVEAGIEWPELIDYLVKNQEGQSRQWGIIQKQTGADRLTLGGSLAANVHGRGLRNKPIIQDVESFVLVDADGELKTCSRTENQELFRAVIGGYGLFGVGARIQLRLEPRTRLERIVKVMDIDDLMRSFDERIKQGYRFGDFQYATDETSPDFLKKGVFSCYRPVSDETPIPAQQKELSMDDWVRLYTLGHQDKRQAFDSYAKYYLSTSGQMYWSDVHQLSLYPENYHVGVDRLMGASEAASEMISEIYVPRDKLLDFVQYVREDFRKHKVDLFYGTIRLIEQDNESFLAWAKKPYVCIIFNLHTGHSPEALQKTAADFRRLIDRAIQLGGSYYLTYHRWATREQVESCYTQFADFLKLKRKYDPDERFQSDWYRHYRKMFSSGKTA